MRISDWSSDVCSSDLEGRSNEPVRCRRVQAREEFVHSPAADPPLAIGRLEERRGMRARRLAAEPGDVGSLDLQTSCRILRDELHRLLSRGLQPGVLVTTLKNNGSAVATEKKHP